MAQAERDPDRRARRPPSPRPAPAAALPSSTRSACSAASARSPISQRATPGGRPGRPGRRAAGRTRRRRRAGSLRARLSTRPNCARATVTLPPAARPSRSARAAPRSAASASPRMPAISETTVSAPAIQSGSPSSVARRRASSPPGTATSQSARNAATMPWSMSIRGRWPESSLRRAAPSTAEARKSTAMSKAPTTSAAGPRCRADSVSSVRVAAMACSRGRTSAA